MFNSILLSLQKNAVDFAAWWYSIRYTYRGGGSLLLAIVLMWEATKASAEGERERKFFLTGMVALGLLAYAAVVFSHGDTNDN